VGHEEGAVFRRDPVILAKDVAPDLNDMLAALTRDLQCSRVGAAAHKRLPIMRLMMAKMMRVIMAMAGMV
jgi:hypothetical protein